MRRTLLTCVLALATTAVVSTASADELFLQTGVSTGYYSDPAFDALSDINAKSDFTLSAAWEFDRRVRLGLLFQTAPRLEQSRFGGDTYLEWGRQKIMATGQYGFYPLTWLRPFVEGGVGYAHQFLAVHSGVAPRLKDHTHDLAGTAALGLQAAVPFKWGKFGVTSSVGYELQTTARFDEMRHDRKEFDSKYEPDDDPWDRARADYGALDLRGVYWTFNVTLAFRGP